MAADRHHFRGRPDRRCDDCHRPDRDSIHYTQVELDRGIDTDDLYATGPAVAAERHLFSPIDRPVIGGVGDCCHCRWCGYPDTHPIHGYVEGGDAHDDRGSAEIQRLGAHVTGPAVATPTTTAGPPRCCCGGPLDAHTGPGTAGHSCTHCLPPRHCAGWQPADGGLDQAIQAAFKALDDQQDMVFSPHDAASIAVEAAAPLLAGDLRQRLDQADRNTAELRDLLVRSMRVTSRDEHGYCQYCRLQARGARHVHCWQCGQRQPGHASDCPVGAALDVAAPAATTETADE